MTVICKLSPCTYVDPQAISLYFLQPSVEEGGLREQLDEHLAASQG